MTDQQLITELKENLAYAIREKDAVGAVAPFADRSVMFVLAPPLQFVSGVNAPGANGVEEWFASFEGGIELAYRDFDVTVGGEVAFAHCLEHLRGKRTDGTTSDFWYRETLGLRKIDGTWKIAHQHQSVPILMDGSGKAAMELKPE